MNEIQTFNFNQNEVRTVLINNEVYFVGKDVAEILGYERGSKATVDHVDEEDRLMIDSETQSHFGIQLGQRGGWLINESGLYSLVLSSKLPSAKAFKRWVTSEVLPQIRRTGAYHMPGTYKEALIQLLDQVEKNEELERKALENKPKVEFYEAVASSKTAIPMDQVAKVLAIPNVGRNKLFEMLRNLNILQKNNIPYQTYVDRGYFRVVESKYTKPNGETCISIKTLVYQKGVEYIKRIITGNES